MHISHRTPNPTSLPSCGGELLPRIKLHAMSSLALLAPARIFIFFNDIHTNKLAHTHTHINARLSQRPRKVIRLSSGAVQLQTQYPSGCKHIPPCTVNKYIYAYAGAFYCTRALSSRESVREQVSNSLQRARV